MNMFSVIAPFYDVMLSKLQQRQTGTLIDRLPDLHGKTILDLGGGTGKLAAALSTEGADVYLLDASKQMLKRAQRVLPGNRIFLGDAARLPFANDMFDVALIVDAIHHMPAQHEVITETRRVLRPGGLLYILDFSVNSSYIRVLQRLERLAGEPSVFFAPDTLAELLATSGLEQVNIEMLSQHEFLARAMKPVN
ncbi:MAG: methyltransferase domain-containing protein [Clostridiales bacterium]|jgi:demethylmenaquinone methyltransferase/2-methoxy-6-polyprenyl-1,4-benzoquinol methylase|nr:methyltransferase domain-containing protein [Clostridiales bacterium]